MGFTDTQTRQLRAKLDAKHVRTRNANGAVLHYVEGWHVVAEANRIFGFDGWDRRTLTTRCVWTGMSGKHYCTAYTARVRIRVRAGDATIVREGSGTGEGKALTPGEAHEIALKSAETDATKRALATFGNRFGLALYDPEQTNVRYKPEAIPSKAVLTGPWILRSASGAEVGAHSNIEAFAKALRQSMTAAQSIDSLFAVWEQNLATVRAINDILQDRNPKQDFGRALVTHLKSCAVSFASDKSTKEATTCTEPNERTIGTSDHAPRGIDKSTLKFGELKRHRSKEHLRYVASQPCLVCGRASSHAHHVRYAQPRGLGLKVSDEFTVPLCAIHHTENHAAGNERTWWQEWNLDPLAEAEKLWRQSQGVSTAVENKEQQ